MELRHLSYFVAVAEELHFGRAAQRLGISQPPLSQQIKQLERDVGAPLFNRNKHSVSLTNAGRAALKEAYQLLEHADRVKVIARQVHLGVDSRLNIGCSSSALFEALPPVLESLRATHPGIGYSVEDYETAAALPALLTGKLDAAFIRVEHVERPLEARCYVRDHYIAAIPSRHRLSHAKIISLKWLVDEPLVIYKRRLEPRTHDHIVSACRNEGFNPNLVFQSPSMQSQLAMVACGLGIAIVPNLVRHWRIPRVVYRPLQTTIEATNISVVWDSRRQAKTLDALLRVVADMSKEQS
jgi:DNA-binding transcriptional LysR family regulator